MKTKARRNKIFKTLEENKRVIIAELAEELDVSSRTILRDLRLMAEMGLVTMVHGGAVYNEGGAALPAVTARERHMQTEKNRLGNYCAGIIKEGNAVYLDTGSTAMNIAAALSKRKNIAVLSNSLPVLNILSGAKNIQLIALTGIYDFDAKGFFGDVTQRALRNFRIDIAFLSVSAISVPYGLMSPLFADQSMKRTVLEVARRKILVTDHTKIGKESFLKVCDIKEIDQIVSDKITDADFIKYVRKLGIDLVET